MLLLDRLNFVLFDNLIPHYKTGAFINIWVKYLCIDKILNKQYKLFTKWRNELCDICKNKYIWTKKSLQSEE